MEDFIGFTYNGKHCIKDFDVYRTSDGSRYNDNLVPSMTDKTADVPGGDGQYFFKTTHKNRQFSVSIAFDHLTEQKYREMRSWLDGREIHDLIFDEAPYKVYSAKVTGTPQLKTICFDEDGQRVYKGEGTIQFTCYYPYAHTPKNPESAIQEPYPQFSGKHSIHCDFIISPKMQITNPDFITTIYYTNLTTGESGKDILQFGAAASYFPSDDKHNDWYIINKVESEGEYQDWETGEQMFSGGWYFKFVVLTTGGEEKEWIYTTSGSFKPTFTKLDFRNINCYSQSEYSNKKEWMFASGLPGEITLGDNFGDLPAPFVVSGRIGRMSVDRNITVGNCSIVLKAPMEPFNFYWDSKSGLVCKIEENDKKVPIPYTGVSYGAIPVGPASVHSPSGLGGLILDYDFWYY